MKKLQLGAFGLQKNGRYVFNNLEELMNYEKTSANNLLSKVILKDFDRRFLQSLTFVLTVPTIGNILPFTSNPT
ncbi:hypothetical protein [Flectobacillus rivi]|uniref:Uncharacterized protein n=1 Tax=Flectobacillus rivi TaxID=2984209 RepID=A0ABT6YVX7_9BACT|nr:hypothetical protein [Flectobacillus rivi]MDI9872890.1 hypothetical protein [Flectobacillus rivi]